MLLHHLGAATYGLWVVLLALVGYLGLLDVGVGTAAVQRVARLTAKNDTEGMADLIQDDLDLLRRLGRVGRAHHRGAGPVRSLVPQPGQCQSHLAGATLIILGVMSALMFLSTVPNAVLFGSGRNDRQTQFGLVTMLLVQVGQIVAMVAGAGLMAVAILQTAGVAVTLVITASIVHRITGASIRRGHFNRRLLRELLSFGGVQTVVALGGVVAYQLDSLVIGIILPVAQVAPYNVALNTSNFTRTLSTQATTSLLPTYAHFEEVGDRERQATYFFRAVMGCLVISAPIVIALAAYGDPILKLWLGTVPPKTYEIMIALGLVTALQLPGHQCFLFLTGTGRNRAMVRLALIGATVNLAGSIGATYWLGPVGPAIGSLPVVLILDSMVLPARVCGTWGCPFRSYVRSALVPVIPASLAAGITAPALSTSTPSTAGSRPSPVPSSSVPGVDHPGRHRVPHRARPPQRRHGAPTVPPPSRPGLSEAPSGVGTAPHRFDAVDQPTAGRRVSMAETLTSLEYGPVAAAEHFPHAASGPDRPREPPEGRAVTGRVPVSQRNRATANRGTSHRACSSNMAGSVTSFQTINSSFCRTNERSWVAVKTRGWSCRPVMTDRTRRVDDAVAVLPGPVGELDVLVVHGPQQLVDRAHGGEGSRRKKDWPPTAKKQSVDSGLWASGS